MSAAVFVFPVPGTPTALGYQLSFFEAGTATPVDVFSDVDLTVPWTQPIVFNAEGNPDNPIYLSPSPDLKIVYEDDTSVAVPGYPFDDYSPYSVADDLPATNITGALSVTGNTTITGTLAVSSGVTFSSTLSVTGAITAPAGGTFGASTITQTAVAVTLTGTGSADAATVSAVYPQYVVITSGATGSGMAIPSSAAVNGAVYTIQNTIAATARIYSSGATINGVTGTTAFTLTNTGNKQATFVCVTAGAWNAYGNT